MSATMKEVKVLEGFFDKDTPKINLKTLADFFGKTQAEVAVALKMDASAISRNPLATPEGKIQAWLSIFNLVIEVITQAEPNLTPEQIKGKMQKWLVLPRPEFESQSPLDYMLKGKGRKVKFYLEQLLG